VRGNLWTGGAPRHRRNHTYLTPQEYAELREKRQLEREENERVRGLLLTELHSRESNAPTRISSQYGRRLLRDVELYLACWDIAREEI
jgi:hypothetical protein